MLKYQKAGFYFSQILLSLILTTSVQAASSESHSQTTENFHQIQHLFPLKLR
jgi:hypothetical protein